jgi:hypothetical protein
MIRHLGRQTERDGLPGRRAVGVDENTVADRVPRDLLEQQRRRPRRVVGDLGDFADSPLPVDVLQHP